MKILHLHKNSAIWDKWFGKKEPEQESAPAAEEPEVTEATPEPLPEEPPSLPELPKVSRKTYLKERNPAEVVRRFVPSKNWSDDAKRAYVSAISLFKSPEGEEGKATTQKEEADLQRAVNEFISSVIKAVCEETNLHYIPWAQVSGKLFNEMRKRLDTVLPQLMSKMIVSIGEETHLKSKQEIAVEKGKVYDATVSSLVELVNSSGVPDKLQLLLQKQQGSWKQEEEDKARQFEELQRTHQTQIEEWQRSQQEQMRHQQEAWQARTGVKTTGVIDLQHVENALEIRRQKFNAIVDNAIEAYRNGEEIIRSNPGVPKEVAFRDLAIILETRFRTKLNLGGKKKG